jgi:hypothetical protein
MISVMFSVDSKEYSPVFTIEKYHKLLNEIPFAVPLNSFHLNKSRSVLKSENSSLAALFMFNIFPFQSTTII